MIATSLIIFLIFFLGIKSQKNKAILIIYLILIMIVILLYLFLAILLLAFPDELSQYLKNILGEEQGEGIEKIKEYNLNIVIFSLISAFFCLLAFIFGIIYFKKLNGGKNKIKDGGLEGDDILHVNNYSKIQFEDSDK